MSAADIHDLLPITVEEEDIGLIDWLIECVMDFVDAGHRACSVALNDRLEIDRIDLDDEAQALVTVEVEHLTSTSRIPLGDAGVGRLVAQGAHITGIGAPDPAAVGWMAVAVGSECTVAAWDPSGMGRLAASSVRTENGRPLGERLSAWWERSGVPAVNKRRTAAVKHLYAEYGNAAPDNLASRIVQGVRVEMILGYFRGISAGWCVLDAFGSVIREETLTMPPGNLAEKITDAMSIEAYDAKRPKLAPARTLQERWTDQAPHVIVGIDDKPHQDRQPGMHYETDPHGRFAWQTRLLTPGEQWARTLSEFTMGQSGPDPTADAAVDLTIRRLVHLGMGGNAVLRRGILLRRRGLSEREVKVLVLHEIGVPPKEIGTVISRSDDTVARIIAAAQTKLR